jgi:hypothetical protein
MGPATTCLLRMSIIAVPSLGEKVALRRSVKRLLSGRRSLDQDIAVIERRGPDAAQGGLTKQRVGLHRGDVCKDPDGLSINPVVQDEGEQTPRSSTRSKIAHGDPPSSCLKSASIPRIKHRIDPPSRICHINLVTDPLPRRQHLGAPTIRGFRQALGGPISRPPNGFHSAALLLRDRTDRLDQGRCRTAARGTVGDQSANCQARA